MFRFTIFSRLWIAFLLIGLVACGGGAPTSDPSLAITQVWRTVEVAQTQTALSASPTPSTTFTPTITPTVQISNTPVTTNTQNPTIPSATSYSLPTQSGLQSGSCDNADFVKDVTIPDGEVVPAGSEFVKTWRFKNLGPCTWTTSYSLVYSYVSDTGKNGVFKHPEPVDFPKTVLPGEEMDISVTLTAPTKADSYQVVFVLQNDEGYSIPLRNTGTFEFYVSFVVK